MTATWFTVLFAAALAAMVGTRLWLARRQIAHVAAHRDHVPSAFADRIGLPAHHKAADYTTAKQRLGRVETVVDALLLLALTFGGGLAALVAWTGALPIGPLWQDVALIASIAVIGAVVSLPFSWYATFVIEERFGFNRMTLSLWLADLAKGLALAVAFGLPLLLLVLWLMREAGERWWLMAWARMDGLPVARARALSDGDRAAVQPFRAAARGGGARAHRVAARTLRLRKLGPVRHGRQQAQRSRQRLLHRLRPGEAGRVLRHAARAPFRRRARGRARARARPLQAQARHEADRLVGGLVACVPCRAGVADGGAVVLCGARHS